MALKVANWDDIERMPCFERQYFYEQFVKLYTDPKDGQLNIP